MSVTGTLIHGGNTLMWLRPTIFSAHHTGFCRHLQTNKAVVHMVGYALSIVLDVMRVPSPASNPDIKFEQKMVLPPLQPSIVIETVPRNWPVDGGGAKGSIEPCANGAARVTLRLVQRTGFEQQSFPSNNSAAKHLSKYAMCSRKGPTREVITAGALLLVPFAIRCWHASRCWSCATLFPIKLFIECHCYYNARCRLTTT